MKMRPSETALHFFYRLNAAAVKAEIPFQASSERRKLRLRRFFKKRKDVQLKTALEGHLFQSISEVERVLRLHEDVWRVDGYETPPTKTRDAKTDNLPRVGLKHRRSGHAFLSQNRIAGKTLFVGIVLKRDIWLESVERSDVQTVEKVILEFRWRAFKTVKHLAKQGMLNDARSNKPDSGLSLAEDPLEVALGPGQRYGWWKIIIQRTRIRSRLCVGRSMIGERGYSETRVLRLDLARRLSHKIRMHRQIKVSGLGGIPTYIFAHARVKITLGWEVV
ncbi:LOW QUALITY PROTEIN: hypothetical protein PHMEG_0005910 [Phytophthora megakarya]|uniref:Uncharacterized protein n=1 Tax=Phytophthora megakarya TaxID=4795 RepID=A0A225WRE7_9STRA|nr:LOW QUALITY PROTEIN: hypothetical protein PHMEG_0005910 [Phytophthora megakarya]